MSNYIPHYGVDYEVGPRKLITHWSQDRRGVKTLVEIAIFFLFFYFIFYFLNFFFIFYLFIYLFIYFFFFFGGGGIVPWSWQGQIGLKSQIYPNLSLSTP